MYKLTFLTGGGGSHNLFVNDCKVACTFDDVNGKNETKKKIDTHNNNHNAHPPQGTHTYYAHPHKKRVSNIKAKK